MIVFRQILSLASAIVFLIAFVPYIVAIVRRQSKPPFFTWALWAALDIVTLVAMISQGASHIWLFVAAIFGASTVALLALKYGERSFSRVNISCTVLVTIAIICKISGAGMMSLAAGLVGLIIAGIPMAVNAWKDPTSEDRNSWILFAISSWMAMAAANLDILGDMLPPLTFLLIDSLILTIVLFRPKRANVIVNV